MSAGLYLQIVRERRGLSRKDIADRLGVSVQTVANLETGKKEPAWTSVAAFVQMVGANIDHVLKLTTARDNEDLARRFAEEQLVPKYETMVSDVVNGFTADELAHVRRELADDPHFLDTIAREVLRRRR